MNNNVETIEGVYTSNLKDKKVRKENTKGITLVALVITIIILLILAGISIAGLIGSGLFEKTKLAKAEQENAQIKENTTLAEYENEIGQYVGGTRNDNTSKTTTLYPGGTKENPSTIKANQRIEIDNPYPGHRVYAVPEICVNDIWGDPGFVLAQTVGGHGVKATQIQSNNEDKIILQSGKVGIIAYSWNCGNGFNLNSGSVPTEAMLRVVIVCLD